MYEYSVANIRSFGDRNQPFRFRIPRFPRRRGARLCTSMQGRSRSHVRLPALARLDSRRAQSLPTSGRGVSFYPSLPRISAGSAELSGLLLKLDSRTMSCVLADHTRLSLARFKWFVSSKNRVACVSLEHIEVEDSQRRKGHARRAVNMLSLAAADNHLALVVQNVVSEHMHDLVRDLGGRCLPGDSQYGQKGAHYWIPPAPSALWQVGMSLELQGAGAENELELALSLTGTRLLHSPGWLKGDAGSRTSNLVST